MNALVASMVIWGTLGVFALWSGLGAMELALSRCIIGGVILLVYCILNQKVDKASITVKNLFFASLSGIFIVFNWVLLFKSFQLASITIGNVSYYLQPVFLVVLGVMLFKEHVLPKQWLFIGVTALGVMLASNLQLSELNGTNHLFLGVLCAVMAGLLYALATITIKYVDGFGPEVLTLVQMVLGAIILLPLVDTSHFYHLSSFSWFNVLLIGAVHTAVASIFYYRSLKKVNIMMIAIISYLDPIIAIFSDMIFFHNRLNMTQFLGIFFTFAGSYYVIRLNYQKSIKLPEKIEKGISI